MQNTFSLTPTITIRFASLEQAREILSRSDDFSQPMGALERAARMKVNRTVSEEDFLQFAAGSAVEWLPAEVEKVLQALELIREKLARLAVALPPEIWLVRTSGIEEGNSAYTRQNAVILPPRKLAYPRLEDFALLLVHEFFHVLSRYTPTLRDALYACIGFFPCGEVPLPGVLSSGRITNPDAPQNIHALRIGISGEDGWLVPVLYSESMVADDEFFYTMCCRFMAIEPLGETWRPVMVDGQPRLYKPAEVNGFYELVGRVDDDGIQPEEILANAFARIWDHPDEGIHPEIKDLLVRS
jgi:hypothetical protein